MATDEKNTQAEENDLQENKEVEVEETQPETPEQDVPSQKSVTDDQISSLKDSITKDVSGKVSQEVSKSVIQKIGDALGLTKKEEEELPTDAKNLKKIIDQELEAKFTKLREDADKEEKQTEQERQNKINNIVQGWYSQYNQLARMGKVPQIKENKEGDAGYDARKKLIMAIGKMIEENKSQGVDYTPSISDVLVSNPNAVEGVPGSNLPISGNTQVRETGESFKYSDIKDKSFEEILAGNL